jgi:hypothetical protein
MGVSLAGGGGLGMGRGPGRGARGPPPPPPPSAPHPACLSFGPQLPSARQGRGLSFPSGHTAEDWPRPQAAVVRAGAWQWGAGRGAAAVLDPGPAGGQGPGRVPREQRRNGWEVRVLRRVLGTLLAPWGPRGYLRCLRLGPARWPAPLSVTGPLGVGARGHCPGPLGCPSARAAASSSARPRCALNSPELLFCCQLFPCPEATL